MVLRKATICEFPPLHHRKSASRPTDPDACGRLVRRHALKPKPCHGKARRSSTTAHNRQNIAFLQ
jgi:hypothetical protein